MIIIAIDSVEKFKIHTKFCISVFAITKAGKFYSVLVIDGTSNKHLV